jgi:hypothetical protein
MQMRELTKSQYMYLKDVLGVEAVMSTATNVAPNLLVKLNVALISAPLSKEEKDLLAKITSAFGWSEFETIVADKNLSAAHVKQLFIFGEEAKRVSDQVLTYEEVIFAPSLGVLLKDTQAKKILWQQMKSFMESKA